MPTKASATATVDMQERMEFLREDLMHLFDDQGVDETQYAASTIGVVRIIMLAALSYAIVFAPIFELHDIKQTGPCEATTRWTMTMKFTPAQALQLSKWWEPVITFTGTSTYGFNPANGKINRHIDTWDSISNQQFFSFEAFGDFWQQLLQTYTTPALESPRFTLLRRTAKFQVRQYEPFTVAATLLDNLPAPPTAASSGNGSPTQTASAGGPAGTTADALGGPSYTINPASAGMKAFNALAGYIFGGNVSSTKMKMTTPVLSDSDGKMQFVVTADVQKTPLASLPRPVNSAVQLQQESGGVYAAAVFNGVATPRRCLEVQQQLLAALQVAGLQPADSSKWTLARYNDPSVKPRFRRNEVLIKLQNFDIWD
eukprot:gene3368-3643_t